MASRIWLHIGTEKTGTTSIQSFLTANRAALAARGVCYPASPGRASHLALAAYALRDEVIDPLRATLGVLSAEQVPGFRKRFRAELIDEVAASGASSLVLSNEHCSARLRSVPDISRLRELCGRIADDVTVVVYLRSQPEFLASWHSTAVKAGSTQRLAWPLPDPMLRALDYRRMLQPWAAVFGSENIVTRRFVASDFPLGDLIDDFAGVIGLDAAGLVRTPRRNEALDADCLDFLRAFNAVVPHFKDRLVHPLRGNVVSLLERMSTGAPFQLEQEQAEALLATLATSNAAVSQAYFGGRFAPLFPPPVTSATRAADSGRDRFAHIAGRLWSENMATINGLRRQLALARGED